MDYGKDYYSILGVDKKASDDDITSAYRKLMRKWHPDLFASKSKAEQEEATKHSAEINEAYDILSDKKKREEYDLVREGGGGRGGPFGGFGPMGGFGSMAEEMFQRMHGGFGNTDESMFRRPRKNRVPQMGDTKTINVELPFENFFFGCTKIFEVRFLKKCEFCNGGIIGEKEEWSNCHTCHGSGVKRFRYGPAQFVQQTCRSCGGSGVVLANECRYCHGNGIDPNEYRIETLEFTIPKDTMTMRFSSQYDGIGHAGIYGGDNGSLIINASLSKDGMFYTAGTVQKLCLTHYVNYFKAMAGGFETIMTPYGKKTVMIPSEMKDGHTIKFNGMGLKGITLSDGSKVDGDLYVTFRHELPSKLDDKDLKRFSKLAETYDDEKSKFINIAAENIRYDEYLKRLGS